jgi:hypothetical protein
MSKKFEEILSGVDDGILNEDSKQAILEAYTSAVDEKVEARVTIEVEDAVKTLDESHATKLETLLEAIDEDHTNKLKSVLTKVDSDYADKIEQVIEKYEGMVQTEAVEFRDQLTTEMSNFMDIYLEKMIPADQIQEAVDNTSAKRIVDQVKQLVSIDEDYISDTIREALQDGKDRMDTLTKELNEAVKTNIQINQDLKSTSSKLVLETKTTDFGDSKKNYVMRVLENKSPEEIKENFDYVVEMFERNEADEVEVLTEAASKKVRSTKVDVPKAEVADEPIVTESTESGVDGYLTELKSQER